MLKNGTSVDIFVAEIAVGYENYLTKKHQGGAPPTPELSQGEMLAMMERVRAKKDENKV